MSFVVLVAANVLVERGDVIPSAYFKFLLQYIKNNDFKAFGYYRIVLGIIVIAYLFLVGDPTLR